MFLADCFMYFLIVNLVAILYRGVYKGLADSAPRSATLGGYNGDFWIPILNAAIAVTGILTAMSLAILLFR